MIMLSYFLHFFGSLLRSWHHIMAIMQSLKILESGKGIGWIARYALDAANFELLTI